MSKKISRRDFIKTTAAAGGAAALMPQTLFSSQVKMKLRIGFIGTGLSCLLYTSPSPRDRG